jgi:vitamin B12 transporter
MLLLIQIYKSDFHLDLGGRLNNHSKYDSHFVYSINPYYLKNLEQFYYKIGFSYATAFIAPTLYQTYGSLPYTLANFDLKPETNSSYEIDFSIGKPDQSFVINASAFLREERDVFVTKQ